MKDQNAPRRALDQIGYEAQDLEAIRHAILASDGLVLVVGSSGCGRRTALRAMLQERARVYPMRDDAGALLLPEIATASAAQFALQTVLAGHLVLSTMALVRAGGAFAELRRLGVTAEQLIDGVSLVIGQRLIQRLCSECSIADDRDEVRRAMAPAANTWLAGRPATARAPAPSGCASCRHSGYQGRVLAYELIEVDSRARGLIASSLDPVELEQALLAQGRTIWDCGLKLIADGATSLDAVRAAIRQPR
jgi:general secretion pathway protein E